MEHRGVPDGDPDILSWSAVYEKKGLREVLTANTPRKILCLIAAPFLIAVCMHVARKNIGIVAFTSNYYGDIKHMMVGALGIPLGIIAFANSFYELAPGLSGNPLFKLIEWIGRNTLLFLGVHGMLLHFFQHTIPALAWYEYYMLTIIVSSVIVACWNEAKKHFKGN